MSIEKTNQEIAVDEVFLLIKKMISFFSGENIQWPEDEIKKEKKKALNYLNESLKENEVTDKELENFAGFSASLNKFAGELIEAQSKE